MLVPLEDWCVESAGVTHNIASGQVVLVVYSRLEEGPYLHSEVSMPIVKYMQVPDQDENWQLDWSRWRHRVTGVWNGAICTVYVYQNNAAWRIVRGNRDGCLHSG